MIKNIEQLIILVTSNCNSKCIHCSYWKNKKTIFLDKKIIFKTIIILKKQGLKSVMVSGGEPFLHPNISEIVSYLNKKKLKIKFATNGICLDEIKPEVLKLINDFSISLDSSNKKTYLNIRGINKFDQVISNLKKLKRLNKNIKLSFLIQKQNYKEIPSFLDLCNKLKIKDISFLVPNKQGDFNKNCYDNYKEMILSSEEIKEFEVKILPKIKLKLRKYGIVSNYKLNHLIAIVNYFKCFNNKFKCNPIRSSKCSFPFNNLVLTEEGKIKPCLFMPYEYKNNLIARGDIKEINEFKNDYLFSKDIFNKHCSFCLEIPL